MVNGQPDDLSRFIRSIPDWPKKGIVFRDITTLLNDKEAFHRSIEVLSARYARETIDKVVGTESRGFIFGAAVAFRLGAGFVPVRKPGKLPATTIREQYQLEYGADAVEIHTDAIRPGERILVVDDLLATGGTIEATCRLVERLKGTIVGLGFLIELAFLHPRARLKGYDVFSIIRYDTE